MDLSYIFIEMMKKEMSLLGFDFNFYKSPNKFFKHSLLL